MLIHPAIHALIKEIDAFRADCGMSPTAFGAASVNDPSLYRDLHNGRQPSLSLIDRVRAFIAAQSATAPKQQEGNAAS